MTDDRAAAPVGRAAVARGIAFALLWAVLLPSTKAGDIAMGAFATVTATMLSLRLLPPASGRVRVPLLLLQVPRLLWESIVAGVDVARRAFAAEPPARTGFVTYRTALRPGVARNGFTAITGLLPGTVPAEETGDAIVYHALGTAQPVVESLAAEERRLAPILQPERPA
ncbi:MAG: Na+/H+ antiporter subunit E [Burkholderiales bacterium]